MDEKRFEVAYRQKSMLGPEFAILVDRVTGVHYLVSMNGASTSGITPLLGPDGKPVIRGR